MFARRSGAPTPRCGCLVSRATKTFVLRRMEKYSNRSWPSLLALDPMELESGAPPHPRHHHMANAQMLSQLAATPVGRTVRRRSAGPLQNPGLQRRGSFLRRPSTMARVQPGQPLSLEAPLPATNIVRVATEQPANRQVGLPLRQQKDQPRPAHILRRQGARAHSIPQFLALPQGQSKRSIKHPLRYTNPIPLSLLQATSRRLRFAGSLSASSRTCIRYSFGYGGGMFAWKTS